MEYRDLGFSLDKNGRKLHYVEYSCDRCKTKMKTTLSNFNKRKTKCCGKCAITIRNTKHGLAERGSNHFYTVFSNMHKRCYSETSRQYKDWGGRGITVCEEWHNIHSFRSWYDKTYTGKPYQIDRIDNDKGYSPENCRWVTPSENIRNARLLSSRNTTGFKGVTRVRSGNFTAHIGYGKKALSIGVYKTAIEAGRAYDLYVQEHGLTHRQNGVDKSVTPINIRQGDNFKKAVLQFDKDMDLINRFNSCKEAKESVRPSAKSASEISRGCREKKKAYGYYWRYEDDNSLDGLYKGKI